MPDLSWLSDQARQIHDLFVHIFYGLATVLLLLGIVSEYFKMPLGRSGMVPQLVARTLIAAILLNSYPEISNAIADFTDALAQQLGGFNQIKLVLSQFGDKFHSLSLSWVSVKDIAIMVISFLLFFLLYISVFLAEAGIIFGWTILYVFSPLLIALYILPATAQATVTLFRSLFELSAWKVVWSVLATLLWSYALSAINQPDSNVNFITVLALNLILAISLLMTPKVVNALVTQGIASVSSELGGVGAAASLINPGTRMAAVAGWADKTFGTGMVKSFASTKANDLKSGIKNRFFPEDRDSKKKKSAPSTPSAQSGANAQGKNSSGAKSNNAAATVRMPEPPQWIKNTPPNTQDPPQWMRSRIEKEQKAASKAPSPRSS